MCKSHLRCQSLKQVIGTFFPFPTTNHNVLKFGERTMQLITSLTQLHFPFNLELLQTNNEYFLREGFVYTICLIHER